MQSLRFLLYILVSIANAVVAAEIWARISFAQEPCFDCVAPRYVKLFVVHSGGRVGVNKAVYYDRLFFCVVFHTVYTVTCNLLLC